MIHLITRYGVFLGLVAFLGMIPATKAQDKEKRGKLPKAEKIIDRYIKVTGGEDAYKKVKTRVAKGTLKVSGITGELTVIQKAPNKMHMVVDIQGIGKIESGTNGKVVWETNPNTGAKIKDGKEKARFLRTAAMDSDYNWRKYFKSAETTGITKVKMEVGPEKGKEYTAYEVKLTTKDGSVERRYFNTESGLVVKISQTLQTPMGNFASDSYVSNYKKVDGISMAMTVSQSILNQVITIDLKSVEQNVKVPDDRFALPDSVKELLKNL